MKGGKKKSEDGETSSSEPSLHPDIVVFGANSAITAVTEAVTALGDQDRTNGSGEEEEEEEEGDPYENLEIDDAEIPKLAEGFYEIEAVRRKRFRKGEVQYLIKWRGWPETSNTWEPFENLLSCSDVIDAFEQRLSSGKHKPRGRKRKNTGLDIQFKKKQHRSPVAFTTRAITSTKSRTIKRKLPYPYYNDLNHSSGTKINTEPTYQENENRTDEHKGTDAALHLQVSGSGSGSSSQVGSGNEPIQSGRFIGARKRKCGTVKRFTQQDLEINNDAQIGSRTSCGLSGRQILGQVFQNPEFTGTGLICRNKNLYEITEIIKPISCTACEMHNVKDVSVTFMAMRSDGKEVMVDNKYLKANHPLMLINFYEKNLRYYPHMND